MPSGLERPSACRWSRSGIIIGILLPVAGTGGVSWAEQYISSGLAALLLATIPIWIVIGAALFDREGITGPVVLALATGFVGIAVLVDPFDGAVPALIPMMVAVVGALRWGLDSIYSRHAPQPAQPLLGSARLRSTLVTLDIDGRDLPAFEIDTDPFVYAIGAQIRDDVVTTVVIAREYLPYVRVTLHTQGSATA